MKVCITASAHIRNDEMCSPQWIEALERERQATGVDIIISHDSWKQPDLGLPKEWLVFDYDAQVRELGEKLYEDFKQFHKNCSIKNFGLWYAYKNGYDVAIVIDSDCIISPGFVTEHLKHLEIPGNGWHNPIHSFPGGFFSRGFPYSKRKMKKWAHMGLWSNEPDLYGSDRIGVDVHQGLKNLDGELEHTSHGSHFPLSGMNVSFVRDAIPYMLFLPVFYYGSEKFNRHDDIWGGYIFQKIANMKNAAFSYGHPNVYHHTEVDPIADAKEEEAMIKYEDDFYKLVDRAISHFNVNKDSPHSEFFDALISEFEADEKFKPIARALAYNRDVYSGNI